MLHGRRQFHCGLGGIRSVFYQYLNSELQAVSLSFELSHACHETPSVAKGFRHSFDLEAERDLGAGYEYIPIDVHVPILDIPDLPGHSAQRIPSNIVIQGSFATDRRDYLHFFEELIASLSSE
jgi:hypothetical protein